MDMTENGIHRCHTGHALDVRVCSVTKSESCEAKTKVCIDNILSKRAAVIDCVPSDLCTSPPKIANGQVLALDRSEGGISTYKCEDGYLFPNKEKTSDIKCVNILWDRIPSCHGKQKVIESDFTPKKITFA